MYVLEMRLTVLVQVKRNEAKRNELNLPLLGELDQLAIQKLTNNGKFSSILVEQHLLQISNFGRVTPFADFKFRQSNALYIFQI